MATKKNGRGSSRKGTPGGAGRRRNGETPEHRPSNGKRRKPVPPEPDSAVVQEPLADESSQKPLEQEETPWGPSPPVSPAEILPARALNGNGEEAEETLISAKRQRKEAPQPPVETPPCLIVMSHPDPSMLGRQYYLHGDEDLIIGRSVEAGISLAGMQVVSRRHARIFHRGEQIMLEDLGSRNGTFLHGQRLLIPAKLNHGDQFSIETVHFRFIGGGNVEQAFHEAMYDLMTHDDLTGIYNRRKYEKDVERDFARAARHGRPLALVLFDIDHFKEINDQYGHICGDVVLRQVATLVSSQLRREGIFARFGGDEFAVLCPEVGLEGARTLAERLRVAIVDHPIDFEGTTLKVTCSFGVAALTPDTRRPSDLYAAADANLYKAKSGGRNQIA